MERNDISDLVRKFFSAFLSGDRNTVEGLMSDDFTFNSPLDHHLHKAAYFERCFPNRDKFSSQQIEKLFVSGNEAFVRYRAELKDGSKFRNTEFFRFEGNKLKEVDVYFGSPLSEDA
jgi:ketosteroid isomerase-like protein